ncbi:MAG TPA: asparagine synthase (glutamine-hydrolyzing) [Bdellovibrionota bacterium]|jgi:asparagine synthase (glutamine-hydrolysing)
MCGFLGAFAPNGKNWSSEELNSFRASFHRLAHRGNSSSGEKTDLAGAALFHYRLAFRDLTEGKQPLTDAQGRATILFNGELYGFRELRKKLEKNFSFRTQSDTEVILAAYLEYGEDFLSQLDGEFAFVIFDHKKQEIVAARDPFGIKPLFWTSTSVKGTNLRSFSERYDLSLGENIFFASEMKGLPVKLAWDRRGLDRLFLSLYEEMGTSFENVYALAPGSLFRAKKNGNGWNAVIERKAQKRRKPDLKAGDTFDGKANELREILRATVQSKLDSDVPLGAYLSGGIDSRIAAFEMGRSGATIETFTVGFEGADYDETGEVKKFLAAYPNLKGRALRTTDAALEYSYPHAIYASELVQPYTNGSAKWWLSRFARRHVRGVLTGDGADELFCGYPSYRYLAWWQFYQKEPGPDRATLFADRVLGKNEKHWEKGLSSRPDGTDLIESNVKLGWAHPLFAQVQSVGTHWAGKHLPEILARERPDVFSYLAPDGGASPLTLWQNYFLHTHFPTHVLNWVGDRMEMANTLEGRPIFLSNSTRDFFRGLPDHYLVRGMRDKAVLRKAYQKELRSFSATPKKQFNAPFLLNGALGKEFLSPEALKKGGLIDPSLVEHARLAQKKDNDPLERSFAQIFLQNCLVAQMLDRYLVRGQPPTRDLAYEESFLDQRTETL